jgi:hypothetical protein
MGKIADVHQARGQLDEALRIRRRRSYPSIERLGDVHAKAVTTTCMLKASYSDVLLSSARGHAPRRGQIAASSRRAGGGAPPG